MTSKYNLFGTSNSGGVCDVCSKQEPRFVKMLLAFDSSKPRGEIFHPCVSLHYECVPITMIRNFEMAVD